MSLKTGFVLSAIAAIAAAQAVVTTGDLALVGVNANPITGTSPSVADSFAIVLLRNFSAGETFNFTDNGVTSGATGAPFATTEQARTWTANAAVAAGTVVTFNFTTDWAASTGTIVTPTGDTNNTGLSSSGDQMSFYNGTLAAPSIITSYSYGTNWITTGSVTSNTSYLPSGFTDGVNALAFPSAVNDFYTGTRTGSKSDLLAALYNKANWSGATTGQAFNTASFTVQTVPEPSAFAALGVGALALLRRRRKA